MKIYPLWSYSVRLWGVAGTKSNSVHNSRSYVTSPDRTHTAIEKCCNTHGFDRQRGSPLRAVFPTTRFRPRCTRAHVQTRCFCTFPRALELWIQAEAPCQRQIDDCLENTAIYGTQKQWCISLTVFPDVFRFLTATLNFSLNCVPALTVIEHLHMRLIDFSSPILLLFNQETQFQVNIDHISFINIEIN